MINGFITIRFLDVIDIVLVAFLLYQLYLLIRGTVAIRIFIGIFSIYLFWLLVKAMKMELLSTILGQVIGVGVIALIIVFQQEIRKFLLMLGNRYFNKGKSRISRLFNINNQTHKEYIKIVIDACFDMGETKTGALISFSNRANLSNIATSGVLINADISEGLIRTIFFKNSPLHDGAMLIQTDKIYAAGCVLPLSENPNISNKFGLRHRAALGLSETTDAIVVVVSEETGAITVARNGKLQSIIKKERLIKLIEKSLE